MEFKLYDVPRYHDEAWYIDREAVDHMHQSGPNIAHRLRLLEALKLIDDIVLRQDLELETLADWGAGNGGLLSEVAKNHPSLKLWGYDLCPANVADGKKRYGLDLQLVNIEEGEPVRGEIVVMTEVLEHLVDPHRILEQLLEAPPLEETRWIVASTPAFETPEHHYEYHLWCWTDNSLAILFERSGWVVKRHFSVGFCGSQFIVAMNPELL